MCTIIIARNLFPGFPIVVVANRDERLGRPSGAPRIFPGFNKNKILQPTDLVRGGTWIGVNEHGVFAGLTNRIDVKSQRGKVSRGVLVKEALAYKSAFEAYQIIMNNFRGNLFNGFNMLIADQYRSVLIRGDGVKFYRHEFNAHNDVVLHVVTNHGFKFGFNIQASTPRRINNIMDCWDDNNLSNSAPTVENLAPLLGIHDAWRHGTCVNSFKANYGTKSSSIIRLNDLGAPVWEYWHRDRLDPKKHICDQPFNPVINLKIKKI